MPILNHFLLDAAQDGSSLMATDLETAFKEPLGVKLGAARRMCIPARKLLEFVREVEGDISLESADGQWLKVKAGKSSFRLACLSEKEFPVWPAMQEIKQLSLPAQVLGEMIEKTLYAAGESDTRYVLNGLLLHIKAEGVLSVVGTDGHRLAASVVEMLHAPLSPDPRPGKTRRGLLEIPRCPA